MAVVYLRFAWFFGPETEGSELNEVIYHAHLPLRLVRALSMPLTPTSGTCHHAANLRRTPRAATGGPTSQEGSEKGGSFLVNPLPPLVGCSSLSHKSEGVERELSDGSGLYPLWALRIYL